MNLTIYQYEFSDNNIFKSGIRLEEIPPKIAAKFDFKEWLFLVDGNSIELIVVSEGKQDPELIKTAFFNKKTIFELQTTFKNVLTGQSASYRFLQIATGISDSKSGGINLLQKLQEAYVKAVDRAQIGPFIHYLFQRGIWLHEKVRQETEYFRFAVQIENVFRELANKILGSLNASTIYINGYHPILPIVLEDLKNDGCHQFIFFENNKHQNPGLIGRFSGVVQPHQAIVKSSTGAEILLIFASDDQNILYDILIQKADKKPKTLLLIFNYAGLNLPVDKIKKISNFYLYGREDLEYLVKHNREQQLSITKEISRWILKQADEFSNWMNSADYFQFMGIIGSSHKMQRIFELVSRISRTDITVLIDGESGTGKEMVARAIHQLSARSNQPFLVINCGAIPENLLESEFFGHTRGAFTGAVSAKKGLFEVANGGTILLDEIAELPIQLQVKLLRALQDGEIKPIGSNNTFKVNIRILTATNKDLSSMVEKGQFRSDLFYRINVIRLTIPPLRERSDDIPHLAHHFLKKFSHKQKKEVKYISDQTMDILMKHQWPGNVRELENVIEHSVALAISKSISLYNLPQDLQNLNGKLQLSDSKHPTTLKEIEKNYIQEILRANSWNYDIACKQLGIGRTTLWRKLREYKITKSS